MNSTISKIEILQKSFDEYLRNKNLRHTAERDAIFQKICETKGLFTAYIIWQQLEGTKFHVSRASIYNTIELLIDAKIIVRHQFTTTLVQYELKYIADQYHHVICTYCGKVQNIKNDRLENYQNYKIPKFTPEYYTLYIYGICSKCKYRLMREEIKERKQIKKQNSNEES